MTAKELTLQSETNRKRLVEIVYNGGAYHIGGDLSCLNVMTALYFDVMNVNPEDPKMPERDRFVLSKGHCVEALYSVLEAKGFITKELTDTLGQFNSVLSGHPTIEVPGIEVNSGASYYYSSYRCWNGYCGKDGQAAMAHLCHDGRRRAG